MEKEKTYHYIMDNNPSRERVTDYANLRNMPDPEFITYTGKYDYREVEKIIEREDCENIILKDMTRLGRTREDVEKFISHAKQNKVNVWVMDIDICIRYDESLFDSKFKIDLHCAFLEKDKQIDEVRQRNLIKVSELDQSKLPKSILRTKIKSLLLKMADKL